MLEFRDFDGCKIRLEGLVKCFENLDEMTASDFDNEELLPAVRRLLSVLEGEQTRAALMKALKLKDRVTFLKNYPGPCLKIWLALT